MWMYCVRGWLASRDLTRCRKLEPKWLKLVPRGTEGGGVESETLGLFEEDIPPLLESLGRFSVRLFGAMEDGAPTPG